MRYAELHCQTNFSFLEGASHADELVRRASDLGYSALAVTDRESLAGIVRAHTAAKEAGLKLLIGAELHPVDAAPLVVWATDRPSYGRLARLLTIGRRRAEKGHCRLTLDDLAAHAEGLLAGVRVQGSGFGGQEEGSRFKVQSWRRVSETAIARSQYSVLRTPHFVRRRTQKPVAPGLLFASFSPLR
jgi:DNA polymerase III alpha subunit